LKGAFVDLANYDRPTTITTVEQKYGGRGGMIYSGREKRESIYIEIEIKMRI